MPSASPSSSKLTSTLLSLTDRTDSVSVVSRVTTSDGLTANVPATQTSPGTAYPTAVTVGNVTENTLTSANPLHTLTAISSTIMTTLGMKTTDLDDRLSPPFQALSTVTTKGPTSIVSSQTPFVSTASTTTPGRALTTVPVRTTSSTQGATRTLAVDTTNASGRTTTTDLIKTSTSDLTLMITSALMSVTTPAALARTSLPTKATAEVPTSSSSAPSLMCKLSDRLWLRTPNSQLTREAAHQSFLHSAVLTLSSRRIRTQELEQNMTRGLTQALKRAFNLSNIWIESLERRTNVFIGFYAVSGGQVFIPATVTETIVTYGIENLTRDLQQHVPALQSILVSAQPWVPFPDPWFQLKTVLQFVSATNIIKFCHFVQDMEESLRKAFEEAESRTTNIHSNLSIQILNASVADGSSAVTMIYTVRNQSVLLNGTSSSSLLHHLTAAELGYYLTYPPLILAEPLEYENLDTSVATEKYWVITVILGVDNGSLNEKYQSFASLMERRLANLFTIAQQQGRRFKRASTIGSYTLQMVTIKRLSAPKNPTELTYYALENGVPLPGTIAAKVLSTVDPQTMALELGYRVQLQAEPVVKNPPNNLWIIAAVLAPVGVVTVIIIIISAVLCRKNKSEFKSETMSNLHQRAKPVQGFDYAKQHIGQQGGEDEVTVTQETVVLPLSGQDGTVTQESEISQDGSNAKPPKTVDVRRSRLPSEQDSVISEQSGKGDSGRSSPQKPMAQQKIGKEETKRRNVPNSDDEEGATLFEHVSKTSDDLFDTSSGSVHLLSVKPLAAPPVYSQPASERSPDQTVVNGEVNKALKQKSDIEHYRNKLRLKAKRKGYYDFPDMEGNQPLTDTQRKMYERGQMEINRVLEDDSRIPFTYTEPRNRQTHPRNHVYRSRQSLNSPSPGGTEMDLLVTRERSRRGIRNSGYDTEPELIEETNIDRIVEARTSARSRPPKGHSETSTLSSQPSIDEVRQHMHQLLEEAFSLASAGRGAHNRHQMHYSAGQPYTELVTSAPGTMTRSRGGVQWVPTYGQDMYQYSLPRPAYRYSQLPEIAVGSPPPIPPRTGPMAVASLRRGGFKMFGCFPALASLPLTTLAGSPAVYAIPANRPGFPSYFIPTPPAPYRSHAWTQYVGDGDVQGQWAENVTLPGYVEAFAHARYPQDSPPRAPRQYSQTQPSNNPLQTIDRAQTPSSAASQQSLTENETSDMSYSNISTAALVKAIREEVAKLAKKQTGMFEFQV
uniref:KIAA1549 like n=1 Tax=Callorhinchus milii TaxID=7868 RepID=A0A4W3JLP1_CALMI